MPLTFDQHATVPTVKISGAPLPPPLPDQIASIVIEGQRNLAAMCVVEFWQDRDPITDNPLLRPGQALKVESSAASEDPTARSLGPLFDGEIVAVEAAFTPEGTRAIVRGYDKSHRMHRKRQSRTFLMKTDSAIAATIAGDYGLTPRTDVTTEMHEYLCQRNQTDWEFLTERARENGFEVGVSNGALVFRKAGPDPLAGIPQTLELGATLLSFRTRVSSADQPKTTKAMGWDPDKKSKVQGTATPPQAENSPGDASLLPATVAAQFGSSEEVVADPPVSTQGQAMARANAVRANDTGPAFEADGTCFGNPALVPGGKVTIKNAGTRFSGTYTLSTVRHVFDAEGYLTHFTISGRQDRSLLGLTQPGVAVRANGSHRPSALDAPVLGTVSSTSDPMRNAANNGRVKVEFPWLGDQIESTWAPVLSPGGGKGGGWHLLPEVGDQVLVVFEQGDPRRPYVLGGIYNSKDKPPEGSDKAVVGGQTELRTFKTRAGHLLQFDDSNGQEKILLQTQAGAKIELTDGQKKSIEIIDAGGNNKVTIDGSKNEVTIKSAGKLVLDAAQDLELSSKTKVKITGTAGVEIKSQGPLDIQSQGPLGVKGTGPVSLESQATTSVKANGPVMVQGTPIKLN